MKCVVADVDEESGRVVGDAKASTSKTVLFTKDLQNGGGHNGGFSKEMMKEGADSLSTLLKETEHLNPDQTAAVATEAFRKSSNGLTFARDLGAMLSVPVHVASATEEAMFGFHSACLSSNASPEQLAAWDCGAGSFQLSTLHHGCHSDCHGSGTTTALAASIIDNQSGIGPDELHQLLMERLRESFVPVPDDLAQFVRTNQVVAIGSQHSMFNQQYILSGNNTFSCSDVRNTIAEVVSVESHLLPELELARSIIHGDADDQDTDRCSENATYMLPKLTLLLAAMEHLQVDEVSFHKTKGNCEALLSQPKYWS